MIEEKNDHNKKNLVENVIKFLQLCIWLLTSIPNRAATALLKDSPYFAALEENLRAKTITVLINVILNNSSDFNKAFGTINKYNNNQCNNPNEEENDIISKLKELEALLVINKFGTKEAVQKTIKECITNLTPSDNYTEIKEIKNVLLNETQQSILRFTIANCKALELKDLENASRLKTTKQLAAFVNSLEKSSVLKEIINDLNEVYKIIENINTLPEKKAKLNQHYKIYSPSGRRLSTKHSCPTSKIIEVN